MRKFIAWSRIYLASLCAESQKVFSVLDINECSDDICHAFSTCTNTVGSHECNCNEGYITEDGYCRRKWRHSLNLRISYKSVKFSPIFCVKMLEIFAFNKGLWLQCFQKTFPTNVKIYLIFSLSVFLFLYLTSFFYFTPGFAKKISDKIIIKNIWQNVLYCIYKLPA